MRLHNRDVCVRCNIFHLPCQFGGSFIVVVEQSTAISTNQMRGFFFFFSVGCFGCSTNCNVMMMAMLLITMMDHFFIVKWWSGEYKRCTEIPTTDKAYRNGQLRRPYAMYKAVDFVWRQIVFVCVYDGFYERKKVSFCDTNRVQFVDSTFVMYFISTPTHGHNDTRAFQTFSHTYAPRPKCKTKNWGKETDWIWWGYSDDVSGLRKPTKLTEMYVCGHDQFNRIIRNVCVDDIDNPCQDEYNKIFTTLYHDILLNPEIERNREIDECAATERKLTKVFICRKVFLLNFMTPDDSENEKCIVSVFGGWYNAHRNTKSQDLCCGIRTRHNNMRNKILHFLSLSSEPTELCAKWVLEERERGRERVVWMTCVVCAWESRAQLRLSDGHSEKARQQQKNGFQFIVDFIFLNTLNG